MKRLFLPLILINLLTMQSVAAETLARRGSLGVRMNPPPEEVADVIGAYVSEVIAGTTGEVIGLEAGDFITRVGDEPVATTQDVVSAVSGWRAGDSARVVVMRGSDELTLTGEIAPRPRETSDECRIEYGSVPFDGGQLRTITYLPKEEGVYPTVYMIQGYTCGSIDLYYWPDSPQRQLSLGLVRAGYAVFHVEKPFVGDSDGPADCFDIDYDYEMQAFDEVYVALKEFDWVDRENIFLFGHSLGGIAAPILGAEHHPRGIAVYGTVAKSWFEYLVDLYRVQETYFGTDYETIETQARASIGVLYEFLINKRNPADLEGDPRFAQAFEQDILGWNAEEETVLNRHYTFWQGLQDRDLTRAWKDAGCATLAMHGECDIQALNSEGAEMIADIVNQYHPGKGRFVLLEGTDHGFAKVPPIREYAEMRRDGRYNGRYLSENFNPQVVTELVRWLNENLAEPG
ncbi:MAG: alpha/beta fold hydrolase [Gemmatimonadetes bacterium]|nr:alpha/beta fold hydrolase [Gemmatimonadota bacterium]